MNKNIEQFTHALPFDWNEKCTVNIEKFAELIIGECIKVLREEKGFEPYPDQVKAGIQVSIAVISDHFGINNEQV